MSTIYTPSPVALGDVTLPSDGDAMSAASVNTPLEGLADGIAYLGQTTTTVASLAALTAIAAPTNSVLRFVKGYGGYLFDTSRSDTVASPLILAADDITPGRWISQLLYLPGSVWPTFTSARSRVRAVSLHDYRITELNQTRGKTVSFIPYWANTDLSDGDLPPAGGDASYADGVFAFLNPPGSPYTQGISICLDPYVHDAARLATVKVQAKGAAGHGSLPNAQWSFGVFRKPKLSATSLSSLRGGVDYLGDSALSTGAYEVSHAITMTTDTGNVIDTSSYTYTAQIWNESGTNSIAGLEVYGLELTFDQIADMRFP